MGVTNLEKVRAWATVQMQYAEEFRKAFGSVSTSDAIETPEYHLGYRNAMYDVIKFIDDLQGKVELTQFMEGKRDGERRTEP